MPYRDARPAVTMRKYHEAMAVAAAICSLAVGAIAGSLAGIALGLSGRLLEVVCSAFVAVTVYACRRRSMKTEIVAVRGDTLLVTATFPTIEARLSDVHDVDVTDEQNFGARWENLSFRVGARGRRLTVFMLEDARRIADAIRAAR